MNKATPETLLNELAKLRIAAENYIAAVECYNSNPWDRVNIRKYADAKARLRELLHKQPNSQGNGPRE